MDAPLTPTGGFGADRAPSYFDGTAGRGAKRLACAGAADRVSGRLHSGSPRLGPAAPDRPLRRDGAFGGRPGSLHTVEPRQSWCWAHSFLGVVAVLDAGNRRSAMAGIGETDARSAEKLGYLGLGMMDFR